MNDRYNQCLIVSNNIESDLRLFTEEQSLENYNVSKESDNFLSERFLNKSHLSDHTPRQQSSQKIKKNKSKRKRQIQLSPVNKKDFYYHLVVKARNRSIAQIVERIRTHYINKDFIYDYEKDKMILYKSFKLKWLPTTYINPIKEIRFLDYVFVLDYEMYKSENFESKNRRFDGSQLGYDKIKKITQIKTNLKNNMIKLIVEEKGSKDVENVINDTHFNIEYFKSWLMSMNDKKTKQIKDRLEIQQEKVKKGCLKSLSRAMPSEGELSNMAMYSTDDKKNNKSEKIWINKLNKATKNWLNDRPFIKKSYEISNSIPEMETFGFNKHFACLVGYQSVLNGSNSGFSFMKNMVCFSCYSDVLISRISQDQNANSTENCKQDLIKVKGVERPNYASKYHVLLKGGKTDYHFNYKVAFVEKYMLNSNYYINIYDAFLRTS